MLNYLLSRPDVVLQLLWEHLEMTGLALIISTALALPLSVALYRNERLNTVVTGSLGVLYTVPSIALIILLLPLFGLNSKSVIVALVLYTQVILLRNFVAGLKGIDPTVLEAARGMGMNGWQSWVRIQLPLALPVMLAGERIAVVVAVAIATIGAKFGAGGLGTLLFDGISQVGRYDKIWAGALSVSLLALGLNRGLWALERVFDPEVRAHRAPPTCQP